MGVAPELCTIVRTPSVDTAVSWILPEGVRPPTDVSVMIALMETTNMLAAIGTASRWVPVLSLRNDGSICGTDGSVCDSSSATVGDNGVPAGPVCNGDMTGDLAVNVQDLLALLAVFGSTC